MIKETFLKSYFDKRQKAQELLKLAEKNKRTNDRKEKKKLELEDRLNSLKKEIENLVINKNGLVSVDDYKESLERLGRIDSELSGISKLQNTSIENVSGLIDEVNAYLLRLEKNIKEVKSSIPNINDLRIETNKKILDISEKLVSKIDKISNTYNGVFEKRLDQKLDKKDLPKPIEIIGDEVGQVIKIDYPKKTVYKIKRGKQSIAVLKGSGGGTVDTSTLVLKAGDTMTGDLVVPDEAYGASWNGSLEVPTKNALYDKIETISGAGSTVYAGVGINITGGTITNTLGFVGTGGVSVSLTGNTYTIYGASTKVNTNETTEGASGLYYSIARFNADLATKTTNNITEGTSSFYYNPTNFVGSNGTSVSITGRTVTIFSPLTSGYVLKTGDTVSGFFHLMDSALVLGNTSATETKPITFAPASQTPINIYQRSTLLTFGTGSGTNNRIMNMTLVSSSGSLSVFGSAAEIYPADSTGTATLGRVGNRFNTFASSLGVGSSLLVNAVGGSYYLMTGLSGLVYGRTQISHAELSNGGSNTHAQIDNFLSVAGGITSWTPSFTNLSVGNGTLLAEYSVVNNTVVAYIHLTFGSSTAISGSVTCSIPTGTISSGAVQPLGIATANNTGAAQYAGIVHVFNASTIIFRTFTVSGSNVIQSALSSTVPFTWGSGDRLTCQFNYLLA